MQEYIPYSRAGRPGYSVYRGILIMWDSGFDSRLLEMIEKMPNDEAAKLLAIKSSHYVLCGE